MDKAWKQVLVSVIIGLLLPRVALSVGLLMMQDSPPVDTQPGQSQQETTRPTQETAWSDNVPVYIPVLTGEADVAVMELESYVLGVVLAEMPASFETDALKAQAVVARTYALRRIDLGDRHPKGAICTDPGCCQAYISVDDYLLRRGTQQDVLKIQQAVWDTSGLVLTYAGQIAEATYFSCSGGRTEDDLEVWGADYPYLQAVDSPGEESAAPYQTSVFFSKTDFAATLGGNLWGNPQDWLGKTTYTQGGGVKTMSIGGKTYSGTELRKLLGLNSTRFTMRATQEGVTVETQGKGHRVGMSQYGADAMAATGKDYLQILAYYYPGTGIDKLSSIV